LALSTAINRQAKVEPIYRGGIVCREHNSSRQFQPQRSDGFYKDNADKKSPNKVAEMPKVKVALAGVGNCASAFVQGLHYYSMFKENPSRHGIRH
jgi:hypothetical protein